MSQWESTYLMWVNQLHPVTSNQKVDQCKGGVKVDQLKVCSTCPSFAYHINYNTL